MVGATLRHYKIIEKIGVGGMGEVYRATDARLGRDVAIKLLPEAFARDPERLARFDQEARLLAALNHPNIAAIYGLEEAEDTGAARTGPGGAGPSRAGRVQFLVLELVPGETLAERLGHGPLPVEEALGVCRQIAEALEAAHERGIIHRDLKPANVKVTPEGKVKVLDFGLAKAFAPEGPAAVRAASPSPGEPLSQSPTVTYGATREGVILGTAPYMSPEQARGKPVDKRTDIWSFGCVLYELLTGKQAFAGETISDTIANILKREPDWQALPAAMPPNIQALLRRCLQREPSRRLQHIGDGRLELEEVLAPRPDTLPPRVRRFAAMGWPRAGAWAFGGALLGALVTLTLLWYFAGSRIFQAAPRVTRFVTTVAPAEPLAITNGPALALSPDGSRLVYVARSGDTTQLYLRALEEFEAKPIPGTEGGTMPFFSPDGQWVGFFDDDGKLKKVAITGSPLLTLCDAPASWGASWSPDDTIFFASRWAGESLLRVSAKGGAPQVVTTPDSKKGESSHRWPEVLPGGRAILFAIGTGASFDDARIAALDLKTGQWRTLMEGGSNPRYLPTGHVLYAHAGALLVVPFDLTRLAVTGSPMPLLEGVMMSPSNGFAQFAVSGDGSLVYVPGAAILSERRLVWVDRGGSAKPLAEIQRPFEDLALSPDARRLALTIEDVPWNVWVYDLGRGSLTRLTFEGTNTDPIWTPDGKRIIFTSFREGQFGLFWKPADGSGPEERLTASAYFLHAYSVSGDGRLLAFMERHPETAGDIWVLRLDGEGPGGKPAKPQLFLRTQFNEQFPAFSPAGHWLVYTSNESGRDEVYVQPYPGPGSKWQISTDGGTHPLWAPNSRELFYRNGDKTMVVPISTHPTFSAGKPRVLFEGHYWAAGHDYDLTPDGQRFVRIKESRQESAPTQINVVLNWFEELKRRVPTGKN